MASKVVFPVVLLVALTLPLYSQQEESKQEPDEVKFSDAELEHFETRIRPLLAKRCFKCHGPDAKEAEGGLRITSRGALLRGGDTGPAIVPGKPEESILIDSINYGEVYEMPPDSKMPADEIKLLTDWVKNKAPWPKVNDQHLAETKTLNIAERKKEHWCWTVPDKVVPPQVKNGSWPLDDLDRFVLAANEGKGLSQAPPADRRTWIRRVYFDLIGLPPTPEQVAAFVNDKSGNAFEKVVDQLLASPHYGERFARHWMDLIRYAETCGHEFDYPIPHAHQYRSYLIRAFNQDVPYDQFIKEQIAGDLIADPRLHATDKYNESILGTGFWFFHEATHAPVDVRLDEANHIDNRIDVMSKSFLGLTVACARCHAHKFDAISTEDYYALAGFLQSSRRQLAMLDPHGKIKTATDQIRKLRQEAGEKIDQSSRADLGGADNVRKMLLATNSLQQKHPLDSNPELDDSQKGWWNEFKSAVTDDSHPLWLWQQVTKNGKAFDAQVLKRLADLLNKEKELRTTDRLPRLFTDFDEPNFGDWFVTGHAFGTQPTRKEQWDVGVEGVRLQPAGLADGSQYSKKLHGVLRSPTFVLSSNEIWYRIKGENIKIRLIIDGYDMDIYNGLLFGGVSINVDTKGAFQWIRQTGDMRRYKGHRAYIEIVDQGGGYAVVDRVVFSDGGQPPYVPATAAMYLQKVSDAKDLNEFATLYAQAIARQEAHGLVAVGGGEQLRQLVAAKRQEILTIESQIPNPVLAQALADGTPEDEFVFVRGNHKTLGAKVERRLLEALAGTQPIPGSQKSSGRLELANQIASSNNPLTSRVIVNRLWHHVFGRGIVSSTDNFGVLGSRPSNQPLLDYLANEFVAGGWSIKKMLKRMVLSQTYRMASTLDPRAGELDPQNVGLHRMSVRRLQAEAIRDSILTVSGRLDPKIGGPSVNLHLTPFMQGRGRPGRNGPLDADGRRSLYIEIRRNFLPPMLVAFDMPIPFNSVGRRNLSNVPAQALILMNDPFVVQQAKVWAEKLVKSEPDSEQRIKRIYEQAFARPPSEKELQQAKEFLKTQAAEMKIKPDDIPRNVEVWKDLCHVIINVKEFIYIK